MSVSSPHDRGDGHRQEAIGRMHPGRGGGGFQAGPLIAASMASSSAA